MFVLLQIHRMGFKPGSNSNNRCDLLIIVEFEKSMYNHIVRKNSQLKQLSYHYKFSNMMEFQNFAKNKNNKSISIG